MAENPLFLAPTATPPEPDPVEQDETGKPEETPERLARRHGRGREYTEQEAANRTRFLDRIQRRCNGADGTCLNRATMAFTIQDLDTETGKPDSESYQVQSCASHKRIWTKNPDRYAILSEERLPELPRYHVR